MVRLPISPHSMASNPDRFWDGHRRRIITFSRVDGRAVLFRHLVRSLCLSCPRGGIPWFSTAGNWWRRYFSWCGMRSMAHTWGSGAGYCGHRLRQHHFGRIQPVHRVSPWSTRNSPHSSDDGWGSRRHYDGDDVKRSHSIRADGVSPARNDAPVIAPLRTQACRFRILIALHGYYVEE